VVNGKTIHLLLLIGLLALTSACATRPYQHESTHSYPIRERAVMQEDADFKVRASVPSEEETQAIFGVPLYQRGIQPVWLEITNNSPNRVRFAPTGTDRDYFSPLEVAYMHKKGFSKEARDQMERRFHNSAMPRQIPAGEIRSGYVFTHASPGTKSFNVDLYGPDHDQSFAFFVTVPGFVPDHAEVDFQTLYPDSDLPNYDMAGLRAALSANAWITSDRSGEQKGMPIGVVIAADGLDLLKALLRAGWYESPSVKDPEKLANAHYLFDRPPDAVFRIQRNKKDERNEMYLWMAPMRLQGKPIWMAQITHFIGRKTQLETAFFGTLIDPNIDDGRDYFLQNVWYAQSLDQMAWLKVAEAVSIENARQDFNDSEYFSDGYIVVTWLSGEPVSLLDTRNLDWDSPPFIP
jgi:hypothetical protein